MKKTFARIAMTLFAVCLLGLVACARELDARTPADSAHGVAQRQNGPANASSSSSTLRVSYIEVGKGDCILIQEGDAAVLIDAGYENTAANVLAHLRSQGVRHLDAMVITHYDRDHIGGIRAIGEGVSVKTVYLPGYEGADKNYRSCISAVKALGVSTQRISKETSLNVGNARLAVYPSGVAYELSAGEAEGNDNDASLVAALTNGRDSLLFAGDLEEDGIAAYLKAKHGQFDVLKMPHHGRRSSNTADFLDDVRPQIVVITDSQKDSADKKTLKLLKSANAKTYRTSVDGTVVVESRGTGTYSVSSSKS